MRGTKHIYQTFQDISAKKLDLHNIQFVSNTSLQFPVSDIKNLTKKNNKTLIVVNVLALLGVDSPLPMQMNVLSLKEENDAWRNFIDVFNDYLYRLLFAAWEKYQPLTTITQQDNNYRKYLYLLSGQLFKKTLSREPALTKNYFPRSQHIKGLTEVIKEYIQCKKVEVDGFDPSWQPIDLQLHQYLNRNSIVGKRILMANGIKIHLAFERQETFIKKYGNKAYWKTLLKLIKQYLNPDQNYKIFISFNIKQMSAAPLGKAKLGFYQVIGKSSSQQYKLRVA